MCLSFVHVVNWASFFFSVSLVCKYVSRVRVYA
jgi:hypothetical protein